MALIGLIGRLAWLMIYESEYYQQQAESLHERERDIKAARGEIIDTNGTVLATNTTVCTISVIHSQIEDADAVTAALSAELDMDEDEVRQKVEKVSSIERISTNVPKETGDAIRAYGLAGVKVDEDFKRYYPFDTLASRVLGFTGSDNQGIIGLEVMYEEYLKGTDGTILTQTDARGIEIEDAGEDRIEPIAGNTLKLSLDTNIQQYAEQSAAKVMAQKEAESVSVIIMNPQNGELMAMVNLPEFDLNDPFTLVTASGTGVAAEADETVSESLSEEEEQELLNQMWRNPSINDTYEPGSTFKIVTAATAIEEDLVSLDDTFSCPGYRVVGNRKIRCHKVKGHGHQTFLEAVQNSCNPVFIDVGLNIGVDTFYNYFEKLGLMDKTGIDLPGEAATIMHDPDDVGPVELATISFGQSFQITPIQLATTASTIVNGGTRVTPHFGTEILDEDGNSLEVLQYDTEEDVISEETSEIMREILESVVAEGSGSNAYIPGFHVGGKTATSQTLPRSDNKYISSFIGFAPADDPQVLALVLIHNPQGIYYGGTVAAPVIQEIFENILPYLGIEQRYTQEEMETYEIGDITMPDLLGREKEEIDSLLAEYNLSVSYIGGDGAAVDQFPLAGEQISNTSNVIVYLEEK